MLDTHCLMRVINVRFSLYKENSNRELHRSFLLLNVVQQTEMNNTFHDRKSCFQYKTL